MKPLNEDYPLFPVEPIETFADLLRTSSRRDPHAPALVDLQPTPLPRLTHGELADAVVRFGHALRRAGLEPGDHVALIGENRVQWAVAYLAVVTAGMVVVPIDKSLQENEILTVLHASDAAGVVFSESFRDTIVTLGRSLKGLRVFVDMDVADGDKRILSMPAMLAAEPASGGIAQLPADDPDRLAVIVFTSGSMGHAKGVMLSQRNITANLVGMLSMIELYPDDRFLSVLPVHHTYECTCGFLCPVFAGASVHYARSLKTVVEDLQRVRATILLGVPLLYDKMYRRISATMAEKKAVSMLLPALRAVASTGEMLGRRSVRRHIFGKIHERFGGAVRIFIAGGAAPDPEVARGLRALGFTFLQGYGLTETAPILALNRLRKFRDDAAGLPLPNVELKIVDPDDEGRGEIAARGPAVMLGYYRNEEATRAVIRDGWFFTGDVGFVDDDGFLHVTGRKKNVIVAANGKNVYPEELEDHVNHIPWVLECVVHGIRNDAGREEIAVTVVPNAEEFYARNGHAVTPDAVHQVIDREIRELNRRLPLHMQIRHVRLRENEFAKTTTQKIKRHMVPTD